MKKVNKPLPLRSLLPRFQLRQPETENGIRVIKHAKFCQSKGGGETGLTYMQRRLVRSYIQGC